jgi:hypothetical protein
MRKKNIKIGYIFPASSKKQIISIIHTARFMIFQIMENLKFSICHYTVTAHCQKYEHRKAFISRTITDGLKFQQIHVPYALG